MTLTEADQTRRVAEAERRVAEANRRAANCRAAERRAEEVDQAERHAAEAEQRAVEAERPLPCRTRPMPRDLSAETHHRASAYAGPAAYSKGSHSYVHPEAALLREVESASARLATARQALEDAKYLARAGFARHRVLATHVVAGAVTIETARVRRS